MATEKTEVLDSHDFRLARQDGYFIHDSVPPSHWCVTKQDLAKLRGVVHTEIQRGHVIPTALDPFNPTDNKYGPCIHTVVEQILKPVCQMAGGTSWALIQNPGGLKCDLFVTHGWKEGIYEFIDKVLYSWPLGTYHAYCCMLANPQTLDIGHLIASPSQSPFAKALASATHVLVVPNRKESIYARAWCTYEAYLAYKWDKTLEVASAPVFGIERHVLAMALMTLVTAIIPVVHGQYLPKNLFETLQLVLQVMRLATVMLHPSHFISTCVINVSGTILGGGLFGFQLLWYWNHSAGSTFLDHLELSVNFGQRSMWNLVFICSHVDLLIHHHLAKGRIQLEKGYAGRIRNSNASVEKDKRMILGEIRKMGEEDIVDETIAVLVKSGMSTTSLRAAYEQGVDITGVGTVKLKLLFMSILALSDQLVPSTIRVVWKEIGGVIEMVGANLLAFSFCLLWLALFQRERHRRDHRAFMATSVWKLLGLPYLVQLTVHYVLVLYAPEYGPKDMAVWYCFLLPTCSCCASITAMLGLDTLLSCPIFAQFTATNGIRSFFTVICRQRRAHLAREPMSQNTVELTELTKHSISL